MRLLALAVVVAVALAAVGVARANPIAAEGITGATVAATTIVTTASTIDTVIGSMTVMPGPGIFLTHFNAALTRPAAQTVTISVYSGGVLVAESVRTSAGGFGINVSSISTMALSPVITGQSLDVRWRVSGVGVATLGARTLLVFRILPLSP